MRGLEEREFQKIYENIATGIALCNLDGFFEECDAAYSALTGYSQDESRKMQFFSPIHPEDLDEFKRGSGRCWRGENRNSRSKDAPSPRAERPSGSAILFPRSPMRREGLLRSSRS
jgi:PAS domain S-box-containing protein